MNGEEESAAMYSARFKKCFLFFLALFLPVFPASSLAANLAAKNSALIIGISQYADINIRDLKYADSDARELANILTAWGGYSPECVITLTNKQATAAGIMQGFRLLEKNCTGPEGYLGDVLIHYSGHAVLASVDDEGAQFVKMGVKSREFLAPFDANLSETYLLPDGSEVNNTFLTKEWFASKLVQLKAKNITVVIDACHSGMPDFEGMITFNMGYAPMNLDSQSDNGASRGLKVYGKTSNYTGDAEKKIVLVAATNEQGVSYEFDELEHGALSFAIINSMRKIREEIQPGTRRDLSLAELFRAINNTFNDTRIRGQRLIDYHQPQMYMVPELVHDSLVFSSIHGAEPDEIVGTLVVRTTPAGANIYIDGVKVSKRSNAEIELPAGRHVVTLQLPGSTYRHVLLVNIRPNTTTTEFVDFGGTLSVKTVLKDDPQKPGPKVSVYLDGKYQGESDLTMTNIVAGTHTLRISHDGVEKEKEVSIRPDSPLLVKYLVKIVKVEIPSPKDRSPDLPF